MSNVQQIHEEKETLSVEVNIPGHAPRTELPIFERTRKLLIAAVEGKCWICGETEDPEAHHFPVERSLATAWDWVKFQEDCKAGLWGERAKGFDWSTFDPKDPYTFVDDMMVNGLLLCKKHHTGKDEGIHEIPHPLWVWQRYAPEGYKMSDVEIIHHEY